MLFVTDSGRRSPWAALALSLLLLFYGKICLERGPVNDFDCYWLGSWAVRDGQPLRMYAELDVRDARGLYSLHTEVPDWVALSRAHLPRAEIAWAYIYPPYCAVLSAPLTFLPYRTAFTFWKLANLAAYLLSLALLLRLAHAWLTPSRLQWTAVLALACPILPRTFLLGQITPLLLLAVIGFFYVLHERRSGLAGFCLAFGIALKISPALFLLWLLWRREYRAVFSCIGTLAALTVGAVAIIGTAPFAHFFRHCFPILSSGTAFLFNIAPVAPVAWALHLSSLYRAEFLPPDRAMSLFKLATYALVFLVSAWAMARNKTKATPERLGAEFALVSMAILLVSPITWSHHTLSGLLPMLLVLLPALFHRQKAIPVAMAAAYLCLLQTPDLGSSLFPRPVGTLFGLFGLLLFWSLSCANVTQSSPLSPLPTLREK